MITIASAASRATLGLLLATQPIAQDSRASQPAALTPRGAVLRAVDWIARQAKPVRGVEGAVLFPEVAGGGWQYDAPVLWGGSAGVLIFLENAAKVLDDERALQLADATVKGLLATRWKTKREGALWSWGEREGRSRAQSLYFGDVGIGHALLVRARLRDDADARAGAIGVGDSIVAAGIRKDDMLSWSESFDVTNGAAGTLLFLLELGQATNEPRFVDAARAAARWLLHRADFDGGVVDTRPRGAFWRRRGEQTGFALNFGRGTAGVAYALARVGFATGDADCISAAKAGAGWLLAHAIREGDTLHWPLVFGEQASTGGWYDGPPGTARLFLLLHRETHEARWLEAAGACARWLMAEARSYSEQPGARRLPPSLCGGVAGVLDFFCDLHRATGDPEHAAFARRAGAWLAAAAEPDGNGVRWKWKVVRDPEWYARNHDRLYPVGLMHGTSGVALALLRLVTLDDRPDPIVHLPDRR